MPLSEVRRWVAVWLLTGWVAGIGLAGCSVFSRGGGGLPAEGPRAPAFELDAIPRLDPSGQAFLDVLMTAPSSLTGIRQPGRGTAVEVRWTVEILERPSGRQIYETSWVESIGAADSTVAASVVSHTAEVPPGEVLVAVTAEDEATGGGYTARQDVQVPALSGPVAVLGTRVEAFDGNTWLPLVSRATTVDRDSMRVRAQIANGVGGTGRVVVERLNVDSTVALPPFAMAPPQGSLTIRGVRIEEQVAESTLVRRLFLSDELAEVMQPIPSLGTGAYRIRVETEDQALDRFLVVRRAGFPSVERVGDLVAAMSYIATESEMRALTARLDPFLQRRAFDRFWGERIPDRRLAATTVRTYAELVEEANRRFSNHKSGWKTDQGMATILFGPPDRVERLFRAERWIYTSGPVSGLELEFEATPGLPAGWPYTVWTLRRGPAYEVAWQRARRAWRRGDTP
ncbi:MAG: GWxTD domain-containing protein [Bacteroidota bacterium]